MFERGMEEKWLCINLLEAIKLTVIYHGCGATRAIFFCFPYSVRSLCPDVHIKVRSIMLKACSHEADNVVPEVLERQSNIWQQHFKVLKLLIPIYSFTFCDNTGCC